MESGVKLVASMVVRNEMSRYLDLVIPALHEFCDEVIAYDDASTDGTAEWLMEHQVKIVFHTDRTSRFYENEGRIRQRLFDATLTRDPTHVLAIDADEFIGDGSAIRQAIEQYPDTDVWSFPLDEVWCADEDYLCVRTDGAWGGRTVHSLFRTPVEARAWRIQDKQLACGREPTEVIRRAVGAGKISTEILHFGWAKESEREARAARYEEHDDGQFHASRHLDSILWPDERVKLEGYEWPPSLLASRSALLKRVRST